MDSEVINPAPPDQDGLNPTWEDKERLKLVLRGSNDALWDWDFVEGKLHYSSRWFEMVGYERAEFTDDPDLWRSILHPEDASRVQRVFSHALENETETYEVEFRFQHKSGHYVPVLSRGFISRDEQGKPIRVSGVNSDLTERKKQEALLKQDLVNLSESEMRFRTFSQECPIPLCNLEVGADASSKSLLLINRAFREFFGYDHTEIPTMVEWLEKGYPDPAYREETAGIWDKAVGEAVRVNGNVAAHEYRVRCRDGRDVIVLIGAIFLKNSLLVTFVDITEQKRAEEELMAARELERNSEERQRVALQQKLQTSMVAASVAHEINQPLGEIILKSQLALDLIQDEEKDDPIERLQIILNGLVDDSNRVVMTIEKMRSLMRNIPSEMTPTDLNEVLQSTLLHLKSLTSRSQVRINLSLSGIAPIIAGDAGQLQLAFANIIKNAVEAMEHLPIELRVLGIDCSIVGDKAQIVIEDGGPGILPRVRDQIFDLLTSSKPRGSGIGLYIVRTAIKNHGGDILVESSSLGGAHFRMLFPLLTIHSDNNKRSKET